LHDKVAYSFQVFKHQKSHITLRHLLTHSSGLIAHRPYFQRKLSTKEVLDDIFEEKLSYPLDSEVVYSDLGYILLMSVIEHVTGQSIQDYVQNHIFKPLGMMQTGYCPKYERHHAPTEYWNI
jgi:CubicO group peptidase (beta-lactamase class C family)